MPSCIKGLSGKFGWQQFGRLLPSFGNPGFNTEAVLSPTSPPTQDNSWLCLLYCCACSPPHGQVLACFPPHSTTYKLTSSQFHLLLCQRGYTTGLHQSLSRGFSVHELSPTLHASASRYRPISETQTKIIFSSSEKSMVLLLPRGRCICTFHQRS